MSIETDNWVDSAFNRADATETVKTEIHDFLDRMFEDHPNRTIQHVEGENGQFHTIGQKV